MSTHANMVKMTVTSVGADPYTITLNAASSGFQSFADAYGANATVDILITQGTVWEVARNCTYTHSGTTVTRGTFEDSSTGSRITTFDNTATVSVVATADSGRRWDGAALDWTRTADAPTTGDVTGVVNTMHQVDISGITAARNFILPAVAAVGDRVGVYITVTHATAGRELIIKANTGDTLNGISAAEWSRIWQVGECVIMRCTEASAKWVVEYDGRIPQLGAMSLTGSDITSSTTGWVGLDLTNADIAVGCVVTVSGAGVSTITWRRESYVFVSGSWAPQGGAGGTVVDNEQIGWGCSYGGTIGVGTIVFVHNPNHAGTAGRSVPGAGIGAALIPAGSVFQHNQYAVTTANLGARALNYSTFLRIQEILK